MRKDGSRFWANVVISALRDRNGTLRGYGKVTRDLTQRKQVEALREAGRKTDEFIAMLGHELRNPLAPIRNALHVLHLRGADPPTVAWAQEVAGRQVEHLTRLVDDLLDVSRIQRGKIELRPERVDLGQLVRRTGEDHRKLLEAAGLTLAVEVPPGPVWVRGDPTRLSQVVGNLLNNAAKFSDPGGRVAVRVEADEGGRRAAVTVRDTGIGIEADMLPRVWETFAQADRSIHRSRGGLGLGLALVKGLVELHGGTVQAASAGPGRGAEFTFWLPLEQDAAALGASPADLPHAGRALRVLIVEDNRDAAETLRVFLELSGHEVMVAHTGLEGLEAARNLRPGVVLCDLGLPGLDGYGVARALRADPATVQARLIAVSGYGQEEDQRRCREAGFDLHMTKPVDPVSLRRLLASLPGGEP